MGWKVSSIIINPKNDISHVHLLEEIGFSDLTQIKDEPYDVAVYPDSGKIYVGVYKNNLIISAHDLPFEFFTKSLSALEEKFITLFPNAEICAISLHSTTNHWGYAVIRDGKKIRARAGDMLSGTTLDFGEPLAEETELLSKSKTDDKGTRMYYLDSHDNEPFSEHQVGENFVFEIFKRYTGIQLDENDELLETAFKGYQVFPGIDSASFDTYFSGSWEGYYILGAGYGESLRGRKTNFLLTMDVNKGEITGTRTEEDKQDDPAATIRGMIIVPFINFRLQYPVRYFYDKNNVVQKDTSRSYTIAYTGLYDTLTESFKGIWNIEDTKCWGEWFMKKKEE